VTEKKENRASFLYTLKSVMWAMFGVRGGDGYVEDVRKITPKQAILVAILMVAVFIAALIFVVSLVIGQASS